MFLQRAIGRGAAAVLLIVLISPPGFAERAPQAIDATLFRIFLRDGSTLVSYGDFARVADRVVFSIPVGGIETATPALHLVSIAESAVDWARTDRYTEATRARHYAETRGEADFNELSDRVARALNDVALTRNAAKRLALATEARRMLGAWPAAHHGYRSSDVKQLAALLDDAIGELRVAAGQIAIRPEPRRDRRRIAPRRARDARAVAAREHRAGVRGGLAHARPRRTRVAARSHPPYAAGERGRRGVDRASACQGHRGARDRVEDRQGLRRARDTDDHRGRRAPQARGRERARHAAQVRAEGR